MRVINFQQPKAPLLLDQRDVTHVVFIVVPALDDRAL